MNTDIFHGSQRLHVVQRNFLIVKFSSNVAEHAFPISTPISFFLAFFLLLTISRNCLFPSCAFSSHAFLRDSRIHSPPSNLGGWKLVSFNVWLHRTCLTSTRFCQRHRSYDLAALYKSVYRYFYYCYLIRLKSPFLLAAVHTPLCQQLQRYRQFVQ